MYKGNKKTVVLNAEFLWKIVATIWQYVATIV